MRIAIVGHLHLDYRIQSFHRMILDDTNNKLAHLDQRACQAHRSDAVYCVQLSLFSSPPFQLLSDHVEQKKWY